MKQQLETLISQMVEKGIVFDEACQEFERQFLRKVLERNRGNQSHAARELGMHRNTLRRKLIELRLNKRRTRRPAHRA